MSLQAPPGGEAATWKGLVIIGGAVLIGLVVTASFGNPAPANSGSTKGTEVPRPKTTVTSPVPSSTSTTTPLREPKDVKVVVANGTATSAGSKKVIDALKPACYAVQLPVDATAKVKGEKRPTTTVYSTPGYERDAATLTTKLGLGTTANAALPPAADLPIPKTGVPTYNVLILVGQDLVDTPPQPLPPCVGAVTSSTTTGSTRRGSATTTRGRTASTTAKTTVTTKATTSTSKAVTTTVK